MKRMMAVGLLAAGMAGAAVAAENDWVPAAATPRDEWQPLALDRIRLGGVFGERVTRTIEGGILKIDADETFLRPFVEKNKGDGTYFGLGKFTEAVVLLAKHTRHPKLLALKDHLLKTVLDHQLPDGYLGCIGKAENRLIVTWDAHECAYLQTALITAWEEFGDVAALAGARKIADYVLANWQRLPADWGKTWCSEPMYTIGQCRAMIRLYNATRETRYLDFCRKTRALDDFNPPLVKGRDLMVWGHEYTYLEQCLAQHELYRLTRDPRLFRATARALDFLFDGNGAMITGLSGIAECWSDAQDGDGDVGETCATVYQLFNYDSLLRLGIGDAARLGDAMERTVYNALFAAEEPAGRKVRYYTSTLGVREYYDGDRYCCPNNLKRGLARLPQWVFYTKADALLVNLYTPCTATATVARTTVALTQQTDYPTSGKIRLAISPERPATFSVCVRIPAWCARPVVKVNGASCRQAVVPGEIVRLTETWRQGDVLELDFPMEIRTVLGRVRQAGRFAVMRGPLVYALNPADYQVVREEKPGTVKTFFERHPFDIQKILQLDPKSLRLSATGDDSSRTGGTAIEAEATVEPFAIGIYFWGARARIRLHEYADPAATVTYFRAPILEESGARPDELFHGPSAQ